MSYKQLPAREVERRLSRYPGELAIYRDLRRIHRDLKDLETLVRTIPPEVRDAGVIERAVRETMAEIDNAVISYVHAAETLE